MFVCILPVTKAGTLIKYDSEEVIVIGIEVLPDSPKASAYAGITPEISKTREEAAAMSFVKNLFVLIIVHLLCLNEN